MSVFNTVRVPQAAVDKAAIYNPPLHAKMVKYNNIYDHNLNEAALIPRVDRMLTPNLTDIVLSVIGMRNSMIGCAAVSSAPYLHNLWENKFLVNKVGTNENQYLALRTLGTISYSAFLIGVQVDHEKEDEYLDSTTSFEGIQILLVCKKWNEQITGIPGNNGPLSLISTINEEENRDEIVMEALLSNSLVKHKSRREYTQE
eukprot:gene4918-6129_t